MMAITIPIFLMTIFQLEQTQVMPINQQLRLVGGQTIYT